MLPGGNGRHFLPSSLFVSQAVLTLLLADSHFPCSSPTTPPIMESSAIRRGGGAIPPHCHTAGLKGTEDYAKNSGEGCRLDLQGGRTGISAVAQICPVMGKENSLNGDRIF